MAEYTYFAAPADVGITWGDISFPESTDPNALTKVSNKVSKPMTFTWGTLFDNATSPMVYYNDKLDDVVGEDAKETYMQNAYNELKAMNEKYTAGSQIKMNMELVK